MNSVAKCRRPSRACFPLILAAAAVFALGPGASPVRAADIDVPPVTILQLQHQFVDGFGPRESAFIPGTHYASDGFSATIGDGDLVRVRVQAPPGKKFRVKGPVAPNTGFFVLSLLWIGSGPAVVHNNPWTATFENFVGVEPTVTYSLVTASPRSVETWINYATHGDFEFTAVQIEMRVQQTLPGAPATFDSARSDSVPFSAGVLGAAPDAITMEIVDDAPVPASASSWGRIKSLYR